MPTLEEIDQMGRRALRAAMPPDQYDEIAHECLGVPMGVRYPSCDRVAEALRAVVAAAWTDAAMVATLKGPMALSERARAEVAELLKDTR